MSDLNLTDREILELDALCSAVVDATITEPQRAELSRRLLESDDARRYYVRCLALSASLCAYAGEMHAEAPDMERVVRPHASVWTRWRWVGGLAAAAAVLAAGLWISRGWRSGAPATAAAPAPEYAARITGASGCRWASPGAPIAVGTRVRNGQRLDLAAGYAEVTFDSGAMVVLKGPASLDVNSPWDGTLRRGALRATVPPEAIGFKISHAAVDVVDLGTEFTLVADASGAANLLVDKGEVEAAPRTASSADQDAILLRARESRRFASSGVSAVDGLQQFGALARPISFERASPAPCYEHWSFERTSGGACPADVVGMPAGRYELQWHGAANAAGMPIQLEAGRPPAVRFDGAGYATAKFPGLSGTTPRTVAFWVRVPADAPLINSYAMVAWGTTARRLSSRPVQISWNRNPDEGPLGAVRTDFGGGFAIGTTPLRDGRWHHVAVVFIPGDPSTPVQVQQYVDGRLDSIGVNPPHPAQRTTSKVTTRADMKDVVWLGCRLGTNGQRSERFVGEISELFISNRMLEPGEIVALMRTDRLPTVQAPEASFASAL